MISLTTGIIENTPVDGTRPTATLAVRIINDDTVSTDVQISGFFLSGSMKTMYVAELLTLDPGEAATRSYYAEFDGFEFQFNTTSEAMEISAWGKSSSGSLVAPHRILPSELDSLIPLTQQSFVQLFDRNYTNELSANTPLNLSNEGINPLYTTGDYTLSTTTVTNDTLNLPGPGLYHIEISLRASFLLPIVPPPFGSTYQILFNILNEASSSINNLVYNGIIPNDPNAILDTQLSIQFLYNTADPAPSLKVVLSNFDFSLAFENQLSVFDIIFIVEKWKNP